MSSGFLSSRVPRLAAFLAVAILAFSVTLAASAAPPAPSLSAVPSAKSPNASLGSSATSGRCSEAAGRRIVKQLRLGDPYVADPFGKVLCGAFTGPGSQAMVVMLRGQGNTGFVHWVVFRWAGGAWQFLMKQPAGASITAAGSDIRQTLPIYRPADSRCCPSGGTKTRIWHWNGSRFVAGPWKQVTPGAAAASKGGVTDDYFKTPSGNIVCGYRYGGNIPASVGCRIKSGLKPPPAGRGPGCFSRNEVFLRATGRTTTGRTICPGEPEGDAGVFAFESVARVLGYGNTWSGGGLRCTSAFTGLTCRNKSGHGFFLSREHWRAF
jgi:uncharacterized protein DUF6636